MFVNTSWTLVDAMNKPTNLSEGDECLYLLRYTPGKGYSYSDANQLVYNYKIKPSKIRENEKRRYYKDGAIKRYATYLVDLFGQLSAKGVLVPGERVALVPVPPSIPLGNEDYDDRNVKTCELVCSELGHALCRDIETVFSAKASHDGGSRDPAEIGRAIERRSLSCNAAETVFLIDDTLTSGAHFTACKTLLRQTGFRGRVFGVFLARSIREE